MFKILTEKVQQSLMLHWQPQQETHDCISINVQYWWYWLIGIDAIDWTQSDEGMMTF